MTPELAVAMRKDEPQPRQLKSPRKTSNRRGKSVSDGRVAAIVAAAGVLVAGVGVYVNETGNQQNERREVVKKHLTERQPCLDPRFFDQLVDPSPDRRAYALMVLKTCNFDKQYVEEITAAILLHDASPTVRADAEATVRIFAVDPDRSLRRSASKTLAEYSLISELGAKGLMSTLEDAVSFAAAHSRSASEESVARYEQVVRELSPDGKAALDQAALARAERAAEEGAPDRAAAIFSSVFRSYVSNH